MLTYNNKKYSEKCVPNADMILDVVMFEEVERLPLDETNLFTAATITRPIV